VYTLVAFEDNVLVEYSQHTGNFIQISRLLLQELVGEPNGKASVSKSNNDFHFVIHDGLVFMCMTQDKFSIGKSFAYLNEIKTNFIAQYEGEWENAKPLEMNNSFSRFLKSKKAHYESAQGDLIGQINQEIADTNKTVLNNLEKVLDRGAKIEILMEKTEQLDNLSLTMVTRTRDLKHKLWLRNVKLGIAIACVAVILILIAIGIGCSKNGFLDRCIKPRTNHNATHI